MTDCLIVDDLDPVEDALAAGHDSAIQFSAPFTETLMLVAFGSDGNFADGPTFSKAEYLARVNGLCATYGTSLTVRFFGHYSDEFDGNVLHEIPDVHALTLNCLENGRNLEVLKGLNHLTKLSFGIYELKERGILNSLPLEQLTQLTLEETATKALDLAPMAKAQSLRHLQLFGHRKNISALGQLTQLEELAFNPVKGVPLEFLNGLTSLKTLKLVLGGTEDLNDVTLPNLTDLALTMVRGFTDLGPLDRFPKLERLLLQDQQHLEQIDFGAGCDDLRHIWLDNCKALADLPGLSKCQQLQSLSAGKTALNAKDLELPKSLTHFSIHSGTVASIKADKERAAQMGLSPDNHPEMPFFYK